MEVPAAVSGEKPRISVGLSNTFDDVLKYFHCSVCGKKLFGYYNDGNIQIMPGEAKFEKSPIVIQCNGAIDTYRDNRKITTKCKANYFIGLG
jgi:hypothetical protein